MLLEFQVVLGCFLKSVHCKVRSARTEFPSLCHLGFSTQVYR